jgi:hypothetical protein
MRIGIFYDIRNPQRWFKPFPQFYAETLDHMQAMDELGFEAINVTEHTLIRISISNGILAPPPQ